MLILVVGPSGVGKDSLIAGAKPVLLGEGVLFPRREITRSADAGGEDHVEVSEFEFDCRERAGGYALSWRAHDLCYGVPAAILGDVEAGRRVVVNGSRSMLDRLQAWERVRVISITASPETLRQRLVARGREDPQAVEERLARAAAFTVEGPAVVEVSNDGDLAAGVAALIEAVRR